MSRSTSKYQILVDSDAFVGWLYEKDAHHKHAEKVFAEIMEKRRSLVTTNYVISETSTVLSHRQGQSLAIKFLEVAEKFPIIHLDEKLHQTTLDLFREQTERGTSVVDCSNVAVVRQFQIPMIFSFDKVYHKKFGLQIAA